MAVLVLSFYFLYLYILCPICVRVQLLVHLIVCFVIRRKPSALVEDIFLPNRCFWQSCDERVWVREALKMAHVRTCVYV